MNREPRAVLWDMDGTLIDSREYHWRAWERTMAEEGITLVYQQFADTFGQRNDTILQGWLGLQVSPTQMARISDTKEAYYRDLLRHEGIALLPGVADWLERLRLAGWRQAIASAAPRANVDAIMTVLQLDALFGAITASEDVQRGKPDPQVFLLAAERLAVPPARCVVIEDAPAGLEAARRANMRRIGVRTTHAHLEADLVVETLEHVPEAIFDSWITP